MTKQIKNKNIFFFDEEKKLYLDNLQILLERYAYSEISGTFILI